MQGDSGTGIDTITGRLVVMQQPKPVILKTPLPGWVGFLSADRPPGVKPADEDGDVALGRGGHDTPL